MKKKLLFIQFIVVLSFGYKALAQGEANIWYFGQHAGLDFNANPPIPLNDGALGSTQGCASISDKNGDLLFYSDGVTVLDKNHVPMPNGTGLLGSASSVQSALIIPHPGTYNYATDHYDKYFIVTVDQSNESDGVRYSEIDMTLNGGLGDVTATKNILLYGTTTNEKIAVAQHSNNCDFWVIGSPVGTTDYYVYAITSSGFNVVPIISPVATLSDPDFGSIKVSPNSKIVTATYGFNSAIYVYDFNNTTGVLSAKFSDNTIGGGGSYSQEFSPDNSKLYYTLLGNPDIYQYDLTVGNNTDFLASRQVIGTTANTNGDIIGALQLAPDGKIYVALDGQTSLGVINDPNSAGIACGYMDMLQDLGGQAVGIGLPAIITCLIHPVNEILIINDTAVCEKKLLQFGLLDTTRIISYEWYFETIDNPNVQIGNSNVYNPSIQFDSAGNYLVIAINHYACYTDTIIDTLNVLPVPGITLISTNVSCFGMNDGNVGTTVLGGTSPYTFTWSNAASTPSINNLAPESYSVTVTDAAGCSITDSAVVTGPLAALVIDSAIINPILCFGDANGSAEVIVSGGTLPYDYVWSSGGTGDIENNLMAGTYTVTVSDSNACTTVDSVIVTAPTQLTVNFSVQDVTCNAGTDGIATAMVSGGMSPYSYLWTLGSTTDSAVALIAGDYVLTVTDANNCVVIDTAIVQEPAPISIIVIPTPTDCDTASGTATAVPANGVSPYSYSWTTSPPQSMATATGLDAATYTVTVTDANGCTQTEQVSIVPKVGANVVVAITVSTINKLETYQLYAVASGSGNYLWTPATALNCTDCPSPTASPNQTTTYCVTLTDTNGCTDSACATITVETPCSTLEVPNAFSPNNDGHNDYFILQGAANCVDEFQIRIFDRWGEKVFETQNILKAWDGTYHDKPMNSGVFVYHIEATLLTGESVVKKGNITLIR